jgi:phosphatidylglycerophosphate synthase
VIFAGGIAAFAAVFPGVDFGHLAFALLAYMLAVFVAACGLHRAFPHPRLGLCNVVTLGRLALAGALVAPLAAGIGASWAVFALALLAMSLDGADGWLARRKGFVSRFGARFDMEVDSALALILALNAATGGVAGAMAVLLGLPRYIFVAAGALCPWMRRDLPERFSRKAVCVLQLAVLIALQAPLLPPTLALLLLPVAAVALIWSFATDLVWLWRHRI